MCISDSTTESITYSYTDLLHTWFDTPPYRRAMSRWRSLAEGPIHSSAMAQAEYSSENVNCPSDDVYCKNSQALLDEIRLWQGNPEMILEII